MSTAQPKFRILVKAGVCTSKFVELEEPTLACAKKTVALIYGYDKDYYANGTVACYRSLCCKTYISVVSDDDLIELAEKCAGTFVFSAGDELLIFIKSQYTKISNYLAISPRAKFIGFVFVLWVLLMYFSWWPLITMGLAWTVASRFYGPEIKAPVVAAVPPPVEQPVNGIQLPSLEAEKVQCQSHKV